MSEEQNRKALASRGRMVAAIDHDPTDEIVKDAIITDGDKAVSNCCGYPIYEETGLCAHCMEHCSAELGPVKLGWSEALYGVVYADVTFDPVSKEVESVEVTV